VDFVKYCVRFSGRSIYIDRTLLLNVELQKIFKLKCEVLKGGSKFFCTKKQLTGLFQLAIKSQCTQHIQILPRLNKLRILSNRVTQYMVARKLTLLSLALFLLLLVVGANRGIQILLAKDCTKEHGGILNLSCGFLILDTGVLLRR
jgi:hypothetical protein